MRQDRDILGEAVARLKQEGSSQQAPKTVLDETVRRLADVKSDDVGRRQARRVVIRRTWIRFAVAAAALIALGCVIGRLSRPAPLNLQELHQALAPSVAASIEPAIRARIVEDLQHRYQLALAATYVKVKEELTEQYLDELNRFAVQFLAASNATTNRLLTQLVESIDTAQAEELGRVAKAIYQIEQNRIQDRAQLAAGLQTLASRTRNAETELSRTQQLVQLLADVHPEDADTQPDLPIEIPSERSDP